MFGVRKSDRWTAVIAAVGAAGFFAYLFWNDVPANAPRIVAKVTDIRYNYRGNHALITVRDAAGASGQFMLPHGVNRCFPGQSIVVRKAGARLGIDPRQCR